MPASLSRFPLILTAAAAVSAFAASASAQCPAVTNFTAQSRGCSVRLTWAQAPGTLPPSVWEIYRNTTNSLAGAVPVGVSAANDFSFDDTPPQRGATFYYFIRGLPLVAATCPQGPQFSPSASGMLLPVATPAGLSSNVTCSGVTLQWNPLPDTVTFEIRRRLNGVPTTLATVPGNFTSFTDSTGAPGVTYDYFVIPTLTCASGVTNFIGASALYPGAPVPSPTLQPVSLAVNAGQDARLAFSLTGNSNLNATYTVQHDGVNVPLSSAPSSRFLLMQNVATVDLLIRGAKPSESGVYTLTMTNTCGTATQSVVLAVRNTCKADINESGAVTVQDIFDFLAQYFAGCP